MRLNKVALHWESQHPLHAHISVWCAITFIIINNDDNDNDRNDWLVPPWATSLMLIALNAWPRLPMCPLVHVHANAHSVHLSCPTRAQFTFLPPTPPPHRPTQIPPPSIHPPHPPSQRCPTPLTETSAPTHQFLLHLLHWAFLHTHTLHLSEGTSTLSINH